MDKLLTTKQVAEVLGLSPRTVESWRGLGKGPPYVRVGDRMIRYRASDFEQWRDQQLTEGDTDGRA